MSSENLLKINTYIVKNKYITKVYSLLVYKNTEKLLSILKYMYLFTNS